MPGVVLCNYCGKPAQLVSGAKVYPFLPAMRSKRFWACLPCRAWVGCHEKSDHIPLGTLANEELRRKRRQAHAAFDAIWKTGRKSRSDSYVWLSQKLGVGRSQCHIAMFDKETCDRVIKLSKKEVKNVT